MLTTTPDHYSSHHPNHYSLQLHPTQQSSVLWAVQVAPRSPRSAGAIAPGSFHLGEILILSQLEEAESHFQPQAPGHSVQLFSPARKAWCPSVFGAAEIRPLRGLSASVAPVTESGVPSPKAANIGRLLPGGSSTAEKGLLGKIAKHYSLILMHKFCSFMVTFKFPWLKGVQVTDRTSLCKLN